MTLFEAATRVPFIIRAPFVEGSAGTTTWALTEMVDLYLLRHTFLLILSPFRSADLFVGVSVWQVLALQQDDRGARRLLLDGLSLLLL